jgi:hypothetical protein
MFDSLVSNKRFLKSFGYESKPDLCVYIDLFLQKFVLKLDIQDDKGKQKALRTVSSLSGIKSLFRLFYVNVLSFFSKERSNWKFARKNYLCSHLLLLLLLIYWRNILRIFTTPASHVLIGLPGNTDFIL